MKTEFVEQQKQLAIMRDILREVQFAFKKGDGINKDNALKLVDFFLADHKSIAWDYILREECEAKVRGVQNAADVFIKALRQKRSTEIDT